MPTGPKHSKLYPIDGEPGVYYGEDCRCTIGEDYPADDAADDGGNTLSVWDAAEIWQSNGWDEDYTFGYSESELRRALSD